MIRSGIGFDAHDFSSKGTLILGGVLFPGTHALQGHSDGDVLLHAIIDALLGAAGLGDIGEFFPDTKKSLKGISSRVMLKEVLRQVERAGFHVVQIDTIVVADKPQVTPKKPAMRQLLAEDLGLVVRDINIKAKTSEGTRLLSARGGIAAWAVATIETDA